MKNSQTRNAKPLAAGGRQRGEWERTRGEANVTPAAGTLKTAIAYSGRSGAVPPWAVRILVSSIGRGITPNRARALRWCLCLAVNAGRIRSMEAERAARCLGGWTP